jgi:uncharacterized protein (DUF2336 family)
MLVGAYFNWIAGAAAAERAEAASVLAQTMLAGVLQGDERADAEAALLLALDDPDREVRLSIAAVTAGAADAPRALILGLCADDPAVAAPVALRSPLLSDADLVRLVGLGEERIDCAIALRAPLSAAVSGEIARRAGARAGLALAANPGAELDAETLARLARRHGSDADVRGLLLRREDLPLAIRQELLHQVGAALAAFVADRGWLGEARARRLTEEAEQSATIAIAAVAEEGEAEDLVDTLLDGRRLTPTLLLRALLCGEMDLVSAALARLSSLPRRRVAPMLADGGSGLAAVLEKAGLAPALHAAFLAAGRAAGRARAGRPRLDGRGGLVVAGRLDLAIVRETLVACAATSAGGDPAVLALLRRFEAEAMRDLARGMREALEADARRMVAPEIAVREPLAPPAAANDAAPASANDAAPASAQDGEGPDGAAVEVDADIVADAADRPVQIAA